MGQGQVQDEKGNPVYFDESGEASANVEPTHRFRKKNAKGEVLYYAPEGTDERNARREYSEDELKADFEDEWNSRIKVSGRWQSTQDYLQKKSNQVWVAPQPVMEPRRYSDEHIDGKQAQIKELMNEIDAHIERLMKERANIEERILEHLWLNSSFGKAAYSGLQEELERVAQLGDRLEAVHIGFGQLPRESDQTEV
jgi:hypothetical protein